MMTDQELITELHSLRNIMVSVSTGDATMKFFSAMALHVKTCGKSGATSGLPL
jgi:hypothetical protein